VEDWATMIMNFEDGSQAVITASDGVLGGVRNTMTVYLSNAVVQVNINPNDTVMAYAPDPHIFGEEYIAEKLETKGGWNFASPDEDWVRGYPQELEDFVDGLLAGREPVSGLDLATETVKAIYAAYLSAEEGMRVELDGHS
jgi:predicted dehydrogenase